MGKWALLIKAEMDGIESLAPADNFVYHLKLKCSNCGEETPKFVDIEADEKSEIQGSRGSANLVIKCKFCSRENSVDVHPTASACHSSEDSQNQKFSEICQFECRGVEPVDFAPGNGWRVICESGTKFDPVDLSDEDDFFNDYDEKANVPVSISTFDFSFESLKGKK